MLIVFKWLFCAGAPSLPSTLLYPLDHEKPKIHTGWSDVRINRSKYNCRVTRGAVGFLFPASAWNSKNKETLVLRCAQLSPKPPMSLLCNIQRWHPFSCQIEQKAWLVVSSLATASRRRWMNLNMKHSNNCLLVYVHHSAISIWHIVTFPYLQHTVWHYPSLLALLALSQDRSIAKKQCL